MGRGGGRKIYRHSSNAGSVIEFDYWGTPMKLFVADTKYRGLDLRYDERLQSHGGPQFVGLAAGYFNGSADNETEPLTYTKDDAWIQSTYAALKNDGTAKSNTDKLVRSSAAYAAHHCRNQNISGVGQLDLPNLYELIILYLESDNIDALDPTVESNRDKALGMMDTNGRFNFRSATGVWSSTESSYSAIRCGFRVQYTGFVGFISQRNFLGVAPVKEPDV